MQCRSRVFILGLLTILLTSTAPVAWSASLTILQPNFESEVNHLSADGTMVTGSRFDFGDYGAFAEGTRWTRASGWSASPGAGLTVYSVGMVFRHYDLSRTNALVYKQADEDGLSYRYAPDAVAPASEVPAPAGCSVGQGFQDIEARISGDGSAVVGASTCGLFRWTQAGGSALIGPSDPESAVRWISDDGQSALGTAGVGQFLWSVGTGYELFDVTLSAQALSGDGTLFGSTQVSGVSHGFLRDDVHGLTILDAWPEFSGSHHVVDIAYDGSAVIGNAGVFGTATEEAFFWTRDGGFVALGERSRAIAMTPDGRFAVGALISASGGTYTAFLWDIENETMRTLDAILGDLGIDVPIGGLGRPIGISDDGTTIAGSGSYQGPWVAIIPEPGTAALLALGLAGLGARRAAHAAQT